MKVVLLAGGYGTRFSEETDLKPKPMIEIGGKPILWHIMKTYSHYGLNDFIICLGYKGYIIKEYFMNYFMHMSDLKVNLGQGTFQALNSYSENWTVTMVDTGLDTMTGGRIKRIKKYLNDETFLLTYGDGVSDINLDKLIEFHYNHGRYATITAVQPTGRFGAIDISDINMVNSFYEKPAGDGGWVNGGFFVLEPQIFDYIDGDTITWEREPLERLARDNELMAYKHTGFWKPMDTLRDKKELEALWNNGNAPWRLWKK